MEIAAVRGHRAGKANLEGGGTTTGSGVVTGADHVLALKAPQAQQQARGGLADVAKDLRNRAVNPRLRSRRSMWPSCRTKRESNPWRDKSG